jgi:hypothetical protein
MYEDEKKSKIDSIKDALYSRSADGIFAKKRHNLPSANSTPQTTESAWKSAPVEPQTMREIPLLHSVLHFSVSLPDQIFSQETILIF